MADDDLSLPISTKPARSVPQRKQGDSDCQFAKPHTPANSAQSPRACATIARKPRCPPLLFSRWASVQANGAPSWRESGNMPESNTSRFHFMKFKMGHSECHPLHPHLHNLHLRSSAYRWRLPLHKFCTVNAIQVCVCDVLSPSIYKESGNILASSDRIGAGDQGVEIVNRRQALLALHLG